MPRVHTASPRTRHACACPLLLLLVLSSLGAWTQAHAQMAPSLRPSGYVRSAASCEFDFLTLTAEPHRNRMRALGYVPVDTTMTVDRSRTLDLGLRPANVQLARVAVQADRNEAQVDPLAPDLSVARRDLKTIGVGGRTRRLGLPGNGERPTAPPRSRAHRLPTGRRPGGQPPGRSEA